MPPQEWRSWRFQKQPFSWPLAMAQLSEIRPPSCGSGLAGDLLQPPALPRDGQGPQFVADRPAAEGATLLALQGSASAARSRDVPLVRLARIRPARRREVRHDARRAHLLDCAGTCAPTRRLATRFTAWNCCSPQPALPEAEPRFDRLRLVCPSGANTAFEPPVCHPSSGSPRACAIGTPGPRRPRGAEGGVRPPAWAPLSRAARPLGSIGRGPGLAQVPLYGIKPYQGFKSLPLRHFVNTSKLQAFCGNLRGPQVRSREIRGLLPFCYPFPFDHRKTVTRSVPARLGEESLQGRPGEANYRGGLYGKSRWNCQ